MLPSAPNPRRERAYYELRATGIKPEAANPLRSGIHSRGYLPHVKREGASYFVTFRLADSLPQSLLLKLLAERNERSERFYARQAAVNITGPARPATESLEEIERDYFRKLEAFLDKGRGECCLQRPDIAGVAARALRFFADKRYRLDAWVVMPNHIHAVLWPMPNQSLSAIVQSWKRFTAREANKRLGRTGERFWQPEAYDHWIRNDREHAQCCRYVINNPVKAGLAAATEDWQWSSASRGAVS